PNSVNVSGRNPHLTRGRLAQDTDILLSVWRHPRWRNVVLARIAGQSGSTGRAGWSWDRPRSLDRIRESLRAWPPSIGRPRCFSPEVRRRQRVYLRRRDLPDLYRRAAAAVCILVGTVWTSRPIRGST